MFFYSLVKYNIKTYLFSNVFLPLLKQKKIFLYNIYHKEKYNQPYPVNFFLISCWYQV